MGWMERRTWMVIEYIRELEGRRTIGDEEASNASALLAELERLNHKYKKNKKNKKKTNKQKKPQQWLTNKRSK